jgi:hypothetical protein
VPYNLATPQFVSIGCGDTNDVVKQFVSTNWIERAILIVDTNIIDPDGVFIFAPIVGHDRISRSINPGNSTSAASAIKRCQLGSLKLYRNSDDLLMSENTPVCRGCPATQ